jgi:hypothetical protein
VEPVRRQRPEPEVDLGQLAAPQQPRQRHGLEAGKREPEPEPEPESERERERERESQREPPWRAGGHTAVCW